MKYSLIILSIIVSLTSLAQSSDQFAELKLDRTDFDFGELHQGEKKSHVFLVKNIGAIPLLITDVYTQCGCTAVEFPKDPIMPGKTAELVIEYDSSDKLGIQRKVVTVISNDKKETKIRIMALVYE